jgi:hypothetical protein
MKNLRSDLFIYLSLSFLLFIYLVLRAIFVPMAHDEIATFHYYVQTADYLPFMAHWDMNNHVVNSALTSLFYPVFGASAFGLRLANLLMFPLFCIYLWKTANLIPGKTVRRIFIITLLFSHGFLEFFSLSRGYGMSMAFLMPVLYYTLRATTEFTTRRMMAAMGWGIVATLANMTLLNTFLILTGWLLMVVWLSWQVPGTARKLVNTLWLALTGLIPAIFFAIMSFKARDLGLLYTGGAKGFFTDTVRTLVPRLTGIDNDFLYFVLALLFIIITAYGIFSGIREKTMFRPNLVLLFFLCCNILSYWLLNRIFHVNYPENRVALYLFPLFAGALCFAVGDLTDVTGRKGFLVILAPLIFFPVHFAYSVNLTHSGFYIEDPVPVSFYNAVKAAHIAGDYPPTVGGHRLRHFCWSFNDFRNGGTESQVYFDDYPGKMEDFQVVDGTDLPEFSGKYSVLLRYAPNDRFLLKRNTRVARLLVSSSTIPGTQGEIVDEYYTLFSGSLDTLQGKSIYIGFEGRIESPSVPFEAWIVAEARDSTGQAMCYEKLALNWLRPEWKGDKAYMTNGILIADLPRSVMKLQLYLWNMKRANFRISNARIEVFRLFDNGYPVAR